jgi:hypothetical protein
MGRISHDITVLQDAEYNPKDINGIKIETRMASVRTPPPDRYVVLKKQFLFKVKSRVIDPPKLAYLTMKVRHTFSIEKYKKCTDLLSHFHFV